ncbi:hypothetical protein CQW23_28044 [Capsicum baccatum]|uniref:Uncharacterized protein n=1 Tax=Capsicum baccatum TaxID=33114 RepID=A0A2G2VFH6_CAPBA|nr:hypothetical protein CQW23_28044 [Capsicum baccatum]
MDLSLAAKFSFEYAALSTFVTSREIQSWSVVAPTMAHDLKEVHLKVFLFSLLRDNSVLIVIGIYAREKVPPKAEKKLAEPAATKEKEAEKAPAEKKLKAGNKLRKEAVQLVLTTTTTTTKGSLDDYVLHGIENMDARFDQPLNFPAQDTNSLIADTDSITPPFCDDDHLPFFDIDYSPPSPSFARSPDLQCAVNSFLAHSSAIVPLDKAQRRWKMLFSVLRWFSARRIVNRLTIIS